MSKATASLVLNGRSKELRVAEETRERVLAIAKEHHYQPSIHARSLRDNRSHTIGLVITDSITPTTELVADIARQHPDEFYFLGGQPRLSPTRDRLEGFKQGLRAAGVELRPEWIIHGNYHPSSGYEMFAELCARLGRPPKALFTAACGLLEGVLRYMGQHNLMQSDIRLASFDDHYLYDSLTIPVDTIRQDNRQLAWHCFDLIGKLIEGETPQPLQRKLDATLQRRYKSAV